MAPLIFFSSLSLIVLLVALISSPSTVFVSAESCSNVAASLPIGSGTPLSRAEAVALNGDLSASTGVLIRSILTGELLGLRSQVLTMSSKQSNAALEKYSIVLRPVKPDYSYADTFDTNDANQLYALMVAGSGNYLATCDSLNCGVGSGVLFYGQNPASNTVVKLQPSAADPKQFKIVLTNGICFSATKSNTRIGFDTCNECPESLFQLEAPCGNNNYVAVNACAPCGQKATSSGNTATCTCTNARTFSNTDSCSYPCSDNTIAANLPTPLTLAQVVALNGDLSAKSGVFIRSVRTGELYGLKDGTLTSYSKKGNRALDKYPSLIRPIAKDCSSGCSYSYATNNYDVNDPAQLYAIVEPGSGNYIATCDAGNCDVGSGVLYWRQNVDDNTVYTFTPSPNNANHFSISIERKSTSCFSVTKSETRVGFDTCRDTGCSDQLFQFEAPCATNQYVNAAANQCDSCGVNAENEGWNSPSCTCLSGPKSWDNTVTDSCKLCDPFMIQWH